MNRQQINSIIGLVIIALLFVVSSILVQNYIDEISTYLDFGFYGMIVYVILTILSIVVAPVSAMPLMPIASALWGWVATGILSIIGWTIGAWIAFVLARKYGVSLVSKLVDLKKIQVFEKLIPEKHLFLGIVIFRMVIPVDGLSYFLGLFSKIKLRTYLLATIIGITPFAFAFAYLGTVPVYYQLIALVIGTTLFVIGWLAYSKKKKDR